MEKIFPHVPICFTGLKLEVMGIFLGVINVNIGVSDRLLDNLAESIEFVLFLRLLKLLQLLLQFKVSSFDGFLASKHVIVKIVLVYYALHDLLYTSTTTPCHYYDDDYYDYHYYYC